MNKDFVKAALILAGGLFIGTNDCAAIEKKSNTASQTDSSNYGDETFFSPPGSSTQSLPMYKVDKKPSEKIRMFIQAGTPDLDQVKLISSLKGKQREQVIKAYERGRAELAPLNQDFNEIRKRMSLNLIERMLSKEEPQMDMMTKSQDFELLLKARGTLQKLRSKRLSLWEEIQAMLSPAQLDELEKLKSGELPGDLLQPANR